MTDPMQRLSLEELDAEMATPLPAKEVISLLDLNIDIDLALDLAAPIDLAVAANVNAAAPIDASVSTNIISIMSNASALAKQATSIEQYLSGEAIADAPQNAAIDQSNDIIDDGDDVAAGSTAAIDPSASAVDDVIDDTAGPVADAVNGDTSVGDATTAVTDTIADTVDDTGTTVDEVTEGSLLDGGLLDVNVDIDVDADMAAPIAGAVAANANVAAPVDASVAANIVAIGSEATAIADQTAVIKQSLDGAIAHATAAQDAEITQ
jgi:hypothetical protein